MSNFIDLAEAGTPPQPSAPGVTRLARVGGQVVGSSDGGPYSPVDGAFVPVVTLPGVMAFPGLATLPGLELWLDASDEAFIVRGATWPQITTWKDKSGLTGRDVTGTATPTLVDGVIGGRRAMKCNPGYFLNTTTNLGSGGLPSPGVDRGARSVFVVTKGVSTAGGALMCYRASVTNNCFVFAHTLSGGSIIVKSSGGADNQVMCDVPNINGVSHIHQYKYDGRFGAVGAMTAVRVVIDGSERPVQPGTLSVAENSVTTGFVIGNFLTINTIFDGYIAEVIAFNRETTPYEDRLISAYLAAKYSITLADKQKLQVMHFGDSLSLGSGDAASVAAGGMRKELNALHGSLLFNVGSFYSPASTPTLLPPDPASQEGKYNRCEGNVGFTSSNNVAHGIGGQYCVTTLTSTPADIIMLFIGINDNVVDGLTAAQSVTNILQIIDQISSILPLAKVVVMRPTLLATFNGSAGTVNPIITAIGPLLEAALVANPRANVLRHGTTGANVVIPLPIADNLYAAGGTDGTHPGVGGWHYFITQGTTSGGFDAELRARGL